MSSIFILTTKDRARYRLTTREFADRRRIKAGSVRRRYSVTGSYFGLKPLRQANGRLLWPEDQDDESGNEVSRG